MDILGNYEKKFLKIVGVEAVRSNTGIYTLKTSSGEPFNFLEEDEVGLTTFHGYSHGDKKVWLSISKEKQSGIIYREANVSEKNLHCLFKETTATNGAKFLSTSFFGGDLGTYSIQIEPYLGAHYFEVYIRNDKETEYPYCIVIDISGIRGIEIEKFQQKQTYGPLMLNVNNFEMVLKGMINKMFNSNEKAKEFFLKLMPFFCLIYNEYEKIPIEYFGDYIGELENEREEINNEANASIERINDERNTKLQQNYKKVLKIQEMTNKLKTR